MPIIEARGLVKKFGTFTAVDGVSFAVESGEVFGFLGPNGAGKTTTISMLCTLLRPSSGSATINGYDIRTQRSEVRRSFGLVFQDPTVDDYLSAEQNLLFHAYAYKIPKDIRNERMKSLLELVGLSDRLKDRVNTFSGGMKRRLELIMSLLHRPRILFLDEPTLGLDPQTRYSIWEYIRSLAREEALTIFLTTHYMEEAEYCNRIAVIDRGKTIALDTPENLKASLGGDLVSLKAEDPSRAMEDLEKRYGLSPALSDGEITFRVARSESFVPEFVKGAGYGIISIDARKPTLDDVFLDITGRAIREQKGELIEHLRQTRRPPMERPSSG